MTPTLKPNRSMRGQINTSLWILDFYESQKPIPQAKGARRLMRKHSRDRLRLIVRARWHGFDINETIYLLGLLDEARQTDRNPAQVNRSAA